MNFEQEHTRNPAIDGARGAAALYVIFLHLYFTAPLSPFFHKIIEHGRTAVPLFFILSGYLLFHSLKRRSHLSRGWRAGFYIHRAFRILPLYWGLLFILAMNGHRTFQNLLFNMFFVFGFAPFNPSEILIYPAWSLFVEEVYYFLLPLIFIRIHRHLRVNLLLFVFFYLLAHMWLVHLADLGLDHTFFLTTHNVLANIHFLFLGLTIAVFLEKHPLFRLRTLWKVGLLIVYFIPMFTYRFPLELACGALAFIVILSGRKHPRFKWPLLNHLGLRCYAIYLIHFPLMLFIEKFISAPLPKGILTVTGAILAAEFSWYLWEKPWMRLGLWVWPGKKRRFSD